MSKIAELAEHNRHTLVLLTIYHQVVRYGWVSYDSVVNALGSVDDALSLGGMLAGLMRAGLLAKRAETPPSAKLAAMLTKPRTTFGPGPLFPEQADVEG